MTVKGPGTAINAFVRGSFVARPLPVTPQGVTSQGPTIRVRGPCPFFSTTRTPLELAEVRNKGPPPNATADFALCCKNLAEVYKAIGFCGQLADEALRTFAFVPVGRSNCPCRTAGGSPSLPHKRSLSLEGISQRFSVMTRKSKIVTM